MSPLVVRTSPPDSAMARSCCVVIVMTSPYGSVNHVALMEIYPPAAVHPHTLKGETTACAGNRGGSSPRQRHRRRRSPHPCGIGAKHPARKSGCRPAVCRAANPGCFVLARRVNAAGAALTLSGQRSDALAAHHTCDPFTVTSFCCPLCAAIGQVLIRLLGWTDSQLERALAWPQSTALEVLRSELSAD